MVKELIKLDTLEKRLVLGFFVLAVLLFFSYGYFIEASVGNIVERKNVEKDIALLNSSLGSLELNYVALKETVGVQKAYELGFVETKKVSFVEKTSENVKLTLNEE